MMNLDKAVLRLGGVAALLGAALAYWVHPAWLVLVAFMGANLVQASFTGFCPAAYVLKKMGVKSGSVFS